MLLEKLTLHRFRSYHDIDLVFPSAGAYITGLNGSGKTNLLEAIFFLANLASFRTHNREELRNWEAAQGIVKATVADRHVERQSELAVQLSTGARRLWLNGKETRDTREFTSRFTAVAFHPGTLQVIRGGPAGRRYLIDRGIASLHPGFARTSQDFQHVLKQRNSLLRCTGRCRHALAVWTERFITAAIQLMRARWQHTELLNSILADRTLARPGVRHRHAVARLPSRHSGQSVRPSNTKGFCQRMGRTSRCESIFWPKRSACNMPKQPWGRPFSAHSVMIFQSPFAAGNRGAYASQGQQRLVAFLLVAALALGIQRQRGHRPVMLLDDIVSELDARNREIIFTFLKTHAFQTFITATEEREQLDDLNSLAHFQVQRLNGQTTLRNDMPYAASRTHH